MVGKRSALFCFAHRPGQSQKRSHRSRYSLNTSYSFGDGPASPAHLASEEERNFLLVLGPAWPEDDPVALQRLLRSRSVPSSMVGLLWMRLAGSDALLAKNGGVYDSLVLRKCEADEERCVCSNGR